ncbi:MAG: carboxypeptidase-like regulatory domain-containing protein [Acidobacteria bacterium]|nr:carboxypeptidase-like regulatory domain-containing protein [Acidobacteriota bacterium]MCI0724176.1 carboxypeptidase-like regulatory domain-containing protein [Acidobacteriota bacterium]
MQCQHRVFLSLLLILSWSLVLRGQINRGVIEGIVTDPQGAVVPKVDLTITSLDTNVAVSTKTNDAGYYRVVDLVPGKYRARFQVSGFSSLEITDIEIPAGKVTRLDSQLKIGETTKVIEVSSEAPLIETAASNFSTTLETKTIEEIPLAGRDLQQLAFLIPGVTNVSGPPGSNFGFNSQFGTFPDPTNVFGSNLSVNGGQGGANAWYLDGNLNLSSIAENIAVNPSPDAVSEFQVISNAFAAEYSRTGGAVFNVVLKSGTNRFRGNIYEFHRNDATNARNPFRSVDSKGNLIKERQLRFNNFGGTLGGPVILPGLYNGKDKTHFFFSWDTSILRLLGQQVFTVPTARMRRGDFSEDPQVAHGIWDPFSTAGPDVKGLFQRRAFGAPVSGNPFGANGCLASAVEAGRNGGFQTCNFATSIPTDRFDPVAQFFMNSYPSPNFNDPRSGCPLGLDGFKICDNFLGAVGGEQKPHNMSIKFDHQWSQKSKYFFEWLFNPTTYRNYRVPWTGPTYPASQVGYGAHVPLNVRNQVFGLGNTYTVNPTLINEFRYSFSRQFLTSREGGTRAYLDEFAAQSEVERILAPLRLPPNDTHFTISAPGGSSLRFGLPGFENLTEMSEAHTFQENVTKIAGKHTLKAGLVYRLEHATWSAPFGNGMGFNGGVVTDPLTGLGGGGGLAQFMLGAVDSGSFTGFYHGPYQRWRYWAAYLQDDIRITPRFSLNVGIRWDLYGWVKTRRDDESNFCLDCLNPLTGLKGKVVYKGDPEFPGPDLFPADKKNFGPRFNFSWAPFADQKTIIRGGYNIFTSNATNGLNSPNHYQVPGWQFGTNWGGSFFPDECAAFSGQCVAFPLSDTTTDKASLATPPLTGTVPAQLREPLFNSSVGFMVKPSRAPIVQMWGLEVERELPSNMMISVGYVGNRGTHLFGESFRNQNYVHTQDRIKYKTAIDANIPITDVYSGQTAAKLEEVYGSSTLPRSILLRDYPFYALGYLLSTAYDGTSIYHGMNLRVQKRLSHGFSFIAAYTASKKITNASTVILSQQIYNSISVTRPGGVGGRAGSVGLAYGGDYQDPDNKRDRIIAYDDIPQMLNVAASYELPFGNGKTFLNRKGFWNAVFGGWKLASNFNTQSGVPLGIRCPGNELTTRCNLIGDPKFQGSRTKQERIQQWMNPAAFEPAFGSDKSFWSNYDPNDNRAYRFGTAGARLPGIRSPGFWNIDTALSKRFVIKENKYLEFRWEAFNALNHQNLGLPNTRWCLPPGPNGEVDRVRRNGCEFGRITNIQTDPRSMQFALKFFF